MSQMPAERENVTPPGRLAVATSGSGSDGGGSSNDPRLDPRILKQLGEHLAALYRGFEKPDWDGMTKVSECRQYAEEYRRVARTKGQSKQREHLLEMARTWDRLAEERSALVTCYPGLALLGEHESQS